MKNVTKFELVTMGFILGFVIALVVGCQTLEHVPECDFSVTCCPHTNLGYLDPEGEPGSIEGFRCDLICVDVWAENAE